MPNIRYCFKLNQSNHAFEENCKINISVDGNLILQDFEVTSKDLETPEIITAIANNIAPGPHTVSLIFTNPNLSIDGTDRILILHNCWYDTQFTDFSETHETINKNCLCCDNDEDRYKQHSKHRLSKFINIETGFPILNCNYGFLGFLKTVNPGSIQTSNSRELLTTREKLIFLEIDEIDVLGKWPFGPEDIEESGIELKYIHPTDKNHIAPYRKDLKKGDYEIIWDPATGNSAERQELNNRTLVNNITYDLCDDPYWTRTRDPATGEPVHDK
jgi:hypothetical protein